MNNFKIILLLLLLYFSITVTAQEGLKLMPLEQDSIQIELGKQLEYQQLISGQIPNDLLFEKMELPKFDFKTEYSKRYSMSVDMKSFNNFPAFGFSSGMMYSPYYRNGMVLSEGAYKFGDKFTFGGFSYGANSMMSAPLPNQGMNKFDTYGSTLFLQYKVSKNFKIETRVNVNQGGFYPGF